MRGTILIVRIVHLAATATMGWLIGMFVIGGTNSELGGITRFVLGIVALNILFFGSDWLRDRMIAKLSQSVGNDRSSV